MKALVWCAPYKVAVENVPEPKLINKRDAIVRVTSTCICGSDLHLVDGFIPFMKPGDVMGHEPMGIVEEVGPGVDGTKVTVGDRVVVPFFVACGECFFCKRELWSCCDLIRSDQIDPSFVVTHRLPLSQASDAYAMFREKRDGCIKVVLDPAA